MNATQKTELRERVLRHLAADTLRQGAYAEDGHYCALGCAFNEPGDPPFYPTRGWHQAQEDRWGIPAWLGMLEDDIFEGLSPHQARRWPLRFVDAMPVIELGQQFADHLAIARLTAVLQLAPTWPDEVREKAKTAIRDVMKALGSGDKTAREAAQRAAIEAAAATEECLCPDHSPSLSAYWAVQSALSATEPYRSSVAQSAASAAMAAGEGTATQYAAWAAEATLLITALTAVRDEGPA